MNSMKLVILLDFISWKKTPNDAVTPQCQSQFTPTMKANAVPRLLSSLVWIDQYNECNGMTSFMEFMLNDIDRTEKGSYLSCVSLLNAEAVSWSSNVRGSALQPNQHCCWASPVNRQRENGLFVLNNHSCKCLVPCQSNPKTFEATNLEVPFHVAPTCCYCRHFDFVIPERSKQHLWRALCILGNDCASIAWLHSPKTGVNGNQWQFRFCVFLFCDMDEFVASTGNHTQELGQRVDYSLIHSP